MSAGPFIDLRRGKSPCPGSEGWQRAAHLLCVRLDNLGDVLMTTPALRALKQGLPGRRLTLLTSPAGAAAAPHLSEVDEVMSYGAPWTRRDDAACTIAEDRAILCELEARRFDGAIIFTVYSQSALPAALLCRLAGIPRRLAHSRENPYALLTDWVVEVEPQQRIRHEVERQLDLVATIGATTSDPRISFTVPARDIDHVVRKLASAGVDALRPWILLHPGATAPSRCYPPERFGAIARRLGEQLGCPIVFGGTAADSALIARARASMGTVSVSLDGQLTLGQCAASIALARLLIANNSGAVHLAAACGTPVVDLYALTNPQHTPWMVPHRTLSHDVPCKYCYRSVCPESHHRCLLGVEAGTVVTSALELYAMGEVDDGHREVCFGGRSRRAAAQGLSQEDHG